MSAFLESDGHSCLSRLKTESQTALIVRITGQMIPARLLVSVSPSA